MKSEEYHIAICDDDRYIHADLKKKIEAYSFEKNIPIKIYHLYSAEELLESNFTFNLLFLDINMPDMDGFTAVKKAFSHVDEYDFRIVIISSMVERCNEAFRINAFRFLEKPINVIDLYEALDASRKKMYGMQVIKVNANNIEFEILENEIVYIESYQNSTIIYTKDMEYRSSRSLNTLEQMLDNRIFFRCHRRTIVNLLKIKRYNAACGDVLLETGEHICVSKRKQTMFFRKIVSLDKERG